MDLKSRRDDILVAMVMQELINKFFRNECNDEERKQVLQHFEDHPEAWDQYLNEADWDNFTTDRQLEPAVSKRLFEGISNHTFEKNRYRVIYTRVAVAASLVLLAGLAWILSMNYGTKSAKAPAVPVIASVQWKETVNSTGEAMNVTMEDGSVITLSPKSRIRYREPFAVDHKRVIYLEGQAGFKVAKDRNKPFTVLSDAVATTALGTQFVVTSFRESNVITVALQEGKVVVQPTDSIQKKWTNDIYMQPGDEVVYNKSTMLASLRHAEPSKEVLVKAGIPGAKGRKIEKPDWYEFNGASLPEVFDQLSAYYQVDIYYYPADIRNKYFTIRLHKVDSLENILRDIALLNHLSINQKNGAYIIKKHQ